MRTGEVMKIRFSKMHGLGNDFVVIDALTQSLDTDAVLTPGRVRALADRHFGIGCDQLLVVEKAQGDNADFRYRIFNADGGEVGQCGNGARCFARFVRMHGLTDAERITVETAAGLLTLQLDEGGLVTVDMGVPQLRPQDIPFVADARAPSYPIDVDGTLHDFAVVSLGNPHAVMIVDDILTVPVATLGAAVEKHSRFPERVNVGFMEISDPNHIRLRVFERGSGETLACGSGACAAVVAGRQQGLLDERVLVELPGGSLFVQWSGEGHAVLMTGPAVHVFEGELEL
jgi:diaminopimelate epimerase